MPFEEQAAEFQDTIQRSVEQHEHPYVVKLRETDFVLFPGVFNPNYGKASLLLLDNLGVCKGDVVLDPFTGCGADAIFAIKEGASRAVAVDKFTMPYLCARYNVARLGLEEKVNVRQGDLFEPLEQEECFDLIIANPPFRASRPDSAISAAFKDAGYTTLQRFFIGARRHLTPEGRIRLVFSNVGDIDFLKSLAKESGFESKTVTQTKYASHVLIEVYEMRNNT